MALTSPLTSAGSRRGGAMLVHVTLSTGRPTFLAKMGQRRRGASPAGAPMLNPFRSLGFFTPYFLSDSRAKGGVLSTMYTPTRGLPGFLTLYSIIELMSP